MQHIYRVTEAAKRCSLSPEVAMGYHDLPHEFHMVPEAEPEPEPPAHLFDYHTSVRAARAAQRQARDVALNRIIEQGASLTDTAITLREMLEDDPHLTEFLTGRAKFRAAVLRFRGIL